MRAVRRISSFVTLAASLLALGTDARAQNPRHGSEAEACFEAAEQAQPLMKARKLRAASRLLATCARDVCPRAPRSDCRGWQDELARVQPTVVFRAREARATGDVAVDDVKVEVDDEVVVPRIDETPVPLDPGAHAFHFEHAGFPAVDQRLELHEGETRRLIDVVFRAAGEAPTAPPVPVSSGAPAEPASPSPSGPVASSPEAESAPVPVLAWALLGGGGVALGVGAAFEGIGLSNRSNLASGCGANRSCSQSEVDSARSQVMVGDIAVGVGLALVAAGAYVYFTRAPASASKDAAGLRLGVLPLFGAGVGGWAALEGSL